MSLPPRGDDGRFYSQWTCPECGRVYPFGDPSTRWSGRAGSPIAPLSWREAYNGVSAEWRAALERETRLLEKLAQLSETEAGLRAWIQSLSEDVAAFERHRDHLLGEVTGLRADLDVVAESATRRGVHSSEARRRTDHGETTWRRCIACAKGLSDMLRASEVATLRRYRTIVVDPPWETTAGPLRGREGFYDAYTGPSRPLAYPTLSINRIAGLPVSDLAAPDCALFLWTTNGYLPAAFDVLKTWGFAYSTTLTWCKRPMGFGLGGAFGITTEFVLYARRGNPEPRRRVSGTWFQWKRPYDHRGKPQHSAKPPNLQDLVETMFDGPYLEMFARAQRLGWDSWGNEALNHIDIAGRA